jgi:ERCC4-related helicase
MAVIKKQNEQARNYPLLIFHDCSLQLCVGHLSSGLGATSAALTLRSHCFHSPLPMALLTPNIFLPLQELPESVKVWQTLLPYLQYAACAQSCTTTL